MATLKIIRRFEFINLNRKFRIYIDGKSLGKISSGETKEFNIPEGEHSLNAKIDWCGSEDFPISIKINETKTVIISGFKYGSVLIFLFVLLFVFYFLFSESMKLNFIFFVQLPIFLVIVYFLTIKRNKYLVIRESNKVIV